ncbi:SDR family NAD(P)-dependent oxidoreductase [Chitinophaga varians]|uniref:SDR family NAD(P)-dependent oxidoreductase n=1 Tax=Chitinophaga varians TaxID=2202339 RepID=UPI001660033E|nr:SDR family NAD(P)-dependent oxidoreductase [Chitinophaga varians]MBC9910599.1 SDR family NAD(P)-dependent oxidoreductase [Chitinophaga varians]
MHYENKTILVTGGTGSFGNYIVHRLLQKDVKEIRILSRDEKKQYDMRIHYKNHPKLKFFIGDIRDFVRVDEVMEGVDIVYQAAALKHVPVCENSPFEAVKTNIIGVQNVITAALKHKVGKFICVSTDKAVKPVNVMGMTKATQERLVLSANHSPENKGTIFCVVRYGNVLLSRGSVIPFFRKQLQEDQEITITDEEMTRFLLTLSDAIDLVMYATENANGGETFVKKAPSARITNIAKVLCDEFERPFSFKVIGKYPGEKLHEILITEEELQRTEDHGDYFTVHPWWANKNMNDLGVEYSSDSEIIDDLDLIKDLIRVADEKAAEVHVEKGEFSKI